MIRGTDLAIVIPTHGRPDILQRTLGALEAQTVQGSEVVVVVDGTDQPVPDNPGVRVLTQEHAGPAAARNRGVAATDRPLVLFLGDDMVPTPTLVEHHLEAHDRFGDGSVAVLGHVDWHPDVHRNRILRWLDWSGTQFDFAFLADQAGADVGFARFYSCNVSLSRSLFEEAGGFDEDFLFYYEDLDAGYRLGQAGMRLRYEPSATVHHLHDYDLAAVERRFAGIALGERLMAAKHAWFEPWFRARVQAAMARRPASGLWPRIVDVIPRRVRGRGRVQRAASAWYHQQVGPAFLSSWERAVDLEDLYRYLGPDFRARLLAHPEDTDPEDAVGRLHRAAAATMSAGTDIDRAIASETRSDERLLDAGDDTGTVGIRLAAAGHHVEFLRRDDVLAAYVRWRLRERGLDARLHTSVDTTGGLDRAYGVVLATTARDTPGWRERLQAHVPRVDLPEDLRSRLT